jgi:YidC/Oxa1 family membrane protein insertase
MNNQNLNLVLAIILSIGIIVGWQYFFERPRLESHVVAQKEYNAALNEVKEQKDDNQIIDVKTALSNGDRLKFENDFVSGSFNLSGMRLDDLEFKKFRDNVDKDSNNVQLLSPYKTRNAYFAEIGWLSSNPELKLPNQDSVWVCDKNKITKDDVATCSFDNGAGLEFTAKISLDERYMFDIKTSVKNNKSAPISIQSYGLIYKTFDFENNRMSIVHEGIAGVFGDELKEFHYKDVKDKKKISNKQTHVNWFGITDKYWLVAFVPDKDSDYTTNSIFTIKNGLERYQADFISPARIVEAGSLFEMQHHIFGGAKELEILDDYETKLDIKLFDRTVDFGWFYVITKPLLSLLHFIYGMVGNFGISIMIITVLVKMSLFSLANKSYRSMKIMKELQPKIQQLKEKCGDDKVRFNQEVMNLYKSHNVNPLAGCLPIFIQIPVFFSLYKVLNVSIDMRHAPFFGWVRDLSVSDPTNIFNLFGLIPFDPPSFMHIGVWPLLMAGTMFLQQRMSPPVSDPVQAQMMKMMPLIFLFMFSGFPAGLLIYWTWNNILSIAQQSYINYSHEKS